MQVSKINNNQPSFGMAFRMTTAAKDIIKKASSGDMNRITNFGVLRATFDPIEETLSIKRADKGLNRFLKRLEITLKTNLGRGKTVVGAKKLLDDPASVVAKADGKIAAGLIDTNLQTAYNKALTHIFEA